MDSGQRITLRTTVRDVKTGDWKLTDESKHPIEAPQGTAFRHLESSGIGTELAVVDSRGRVHVYSSLHSPMGKLSQSPIIVEDSKNMGGDLDAVVGMHWLAMWPTEFRVSERASLKDSCCMAVTNLHVKIPYITPARKVGDKWASSMRHCDQNEPSVHHAAEQRNAFLFVTQDANLTLMYQIEGSWHSTSVKLENLASSDEMLTHAALGEDGGHLLLVTHDLTKRLRLYKVVISWNPSQQTRSSGMQYIAVAPTLDIGHLTTVDNVAAQLEGAARLSTLKIVSATPGFVDYGTPTFPTVLAIFSRASLPSDPTQQSQESFSVISRWHLEMVTPTLHESFTKLKKTNSITPIQAPVTVARRHEDIVTNRVVTSVSSQAYQTVLCFSASDGTIEFRDRATMTSIEPYGDSDVVSSLPQSGFEQMLTDYNAHVAASADGSAVVYEEAGGKLAVKTMALRYSWQPLDDGISDTSGLIEAAVVSAARQYSILSISQLANEENLALLPHDLSAELRCLFVKEVVKITNRTIDIAGHDPRQQSMWAIKEPFVPRAMSAQLVLAVKPGTTKRSVVGKFAYCFLHMRASSQLLAQMITQANQYVRPDVLHSMRGAMRWGSELLVFIAGTLIDLEPKIRAAAGDAKSASSVKAAFQGMLVEERENPAVHLILNAITRAFLKFLAQNLPKYLTAIQRILPVASSVLQRQQLQEAYEKGTSPHLPFRYSDFETMLQSIDAAVKQAYTSAGLPAEKRAEIELQLLCESQLPDELAAPLQILLDTALPTFTTAADQSKLFFWDTTWLGIDSVAAARDIDAIKKLPLAKDAVLRVRRRCGARMEDVDMRRSPQWLAGAQRSCICGSGWWLAD